MKRLRFSGSARLETCSAETVVPRMTNRSTPASTTVFQNSWVRCGDRAPATVTPASRIWPRRCGDQLGAGSARRRSPASAGWRWPGPARRSRRAAAVGSSYRVHRPSRSSTGRPPRRPKAIAVSGEIDRVHRRGDHRQVEVVGVDLPGDRHLLGVAGAPRGHHRDVVEGVGAATALAAANLDLGHAARLPAMAGEPGHRRSAAAVVGRLDGHLDVVRVALLEPGRGDPHELPALLQLGDGARADVEHRLLQAADQLVRRPS